MAKAELLGRDMMDRLDPEILRKVEAGFKIGQIMNQEGLRAGESGQVKELREYIARDAK